MLACLAIARVDEQPSDPGLELVGVPQALEVSPGGEQRLLRRVLGLGVVSDPMRHDSAGIEIVLPGGARVRVSGGVDRAALAEVLGKTQDAAIFREHSLYYKNHWDPHTQFMRGRNEDGSWVEPDEEFDAEFDDVKVKAVER